MKIYIKINKLKKGLSSNTEVYQKDSKRIYQYPKVKKSLKLQNRNNSVIYNKK